MKPEKKFAVIWTKEAKKQYGVGKNDTIISVEPLAEIKVNISPNKLGRPVYRYCDPLALFNTFKEAEAFREGNSDWKTVKVDLLIHKD